MSSGPLKFAKSFPIHIPNLLRALGLVWRAAPGLSLAWVSLLVIQGLLPALTVIFTRQLVDQLAIVIGAVNATGVAGEGLGTLTMLIAAIAGLILLGQVLSSLNGWIRTSQSEKVTIQITEQIQQRSSAVDYAFYETPADFDRLHRARAEASYRPLAVLDNLGALVQNSITLVAMGLVLLPYGWWLPLVLLTSTLPALLIVIGNQRKMYAWQKKVTTEQRLVYYYDWLQSTQESAAELRMLGLGKYFRQNYGRLRQKIFTESQILNRQQIIGQVVASLIGLMAIGGCLVWLGWRALQGQATMGDLALFYQALNQGQSLLRSLLQTGGQLYGNMLFLTNLFEFLDLPDKVVNPVEPLPFPAPTASGGVQLNFDNVSFAYPGATDPTLHDFYLEIEAGQTVAIVGDNGAGKSTLIKLLCRLYDPQAGRITWQGVDLRQLPLAELRRQVTVLFQEPMHYHASVSENIAYGDWKIAGIDLEQVHLAAKQAGAERLIEHLPMAYATQLGKWFHEGTELSVGEWQRIALARAFLRSAPLLILDEPTSAMDAWAEADWLSRVHQWSARRTTLIITQRLTTARQADKIYVLEAGRIIEAGCHAELLALNGRYAQAWYAQTPAQDTSYLEESV
jgi:ATP-binding cassette subfamily B protein